MEKVLIADFSSGKDRVTVRGLWQFDRGVKLKVIGINVADVNRVDFAPVIASEAVPVVVTPDEDGTFTVSIPGAATKSPYDVTAYIYVDAAEYGYTTKAVSMPVILRPEAGKPGEEEKPDPFGEVVEKVSGYAKEARDSARAASESASKSEKIAEQVAVLEKQVELSVKKANASEQAAGISESNATESEEKARESATAACSAADQAAKSATDAAESTTTATQQAANAAQSAANAARSAESASQSAETAKTAADAASKSGSAAQQAAGSASESASTATAAAQTATTAAGNAAESVTLANQSAETAGQKATAAETSASNAAESATAAEKSATAAEDSASAAKASETAAGEAAQTAQEQAEKITESAEQIEKNKAGVAALEEKKADKTTLAVTERKLDALWKLNQGVSYQFEEDSTEAYQKTVPIGAKLASIKKIGGKTIVWNQLFNSNTIKTTTYKGVTFTNNGDGTYTANGTATEESLISIAITFTKGHMYYMRSLTTIASSRTYKAYITGNNIFTKMTDLGYGTIDTATVGNRGYFVPLYISKGVTVENLKIAPKIIDLTQMFGVGNEPSTVEEFEAVFPEENYLYNAGELMSASVNKVIYLDTKNQETSYPIPQDIRNLPGYGWSAGNVRNEVNWENKKYIQLIGHYEFSENTAVRLLKNNSTDIYCAFFAGVKNVKVNIAVNGILSKNFASKYIGGSTRAEGVCCETAGWLEYKVLFEKLGCTKEDDDETVITAINKYMIDMAEEANYPLIEPIVTDISDLIGDTFQEPFEVEAGGTLTFKNSNGDGFRIPVPNTEEYIVKLSEVAET